MHGFKFRQRVLGIKAKVFSRQNSTSTPTERRQEQSEVTPPSPSYSKRCSSHASSSTAAEKEKARGHGEPEERERGSAGPKSQRTSILSSTVTDRTSLGMGWGGRSGAETREPTATTPATDTATESTEFAEPGSVDPATPATPVSPAALLSADAGTESTEFVEGAESGEPPSSTAAAAATPAAPGPKRDPPAPPFPSPSPLHDEQRQQFHSRCGPPNGSAGPPRSPRPRDDDQSSPPSPATASDAPQPRSTPPRQPSPPPPPLSRAHPQLHLLTPLHPPLPVPLASASSASAQATPNSIALTADRVSTEPLSPSIGHSAAPRTAPARAPPPPPPSSSSFPTESPLPPFPYTRSPIYRKQSLLPPSAAGLINSLLKPEASPFPEEPEAEFQLPSPATLGSAMSRKIWVKRPNGSPTLVNVNENDVVDDVRDAVLQKYQNALAKNYDAPDISLRIIPRGGHPRSLSHGHGQPSGDRLLNPDEPIIPTLNEYYSGNQTSEEALVIEVPQKRTPRPSPGHAHTYPYSAAHDPQLGMEGSEYFPPMPPSSSGHSQNQPPPSTQAAMSQNSLVGPVPIPGSPGTRKTHRPPMVRRMHTSSPTLHPSGATGQSGGVILATRKSRSRVNSDAATSKPLPPPPLIPTPPTDTAPQKVSTPPPPRVSSPLSKKFKKEKKHTSPAGLLPDGAVPPINVLIVEDNVINLRLLEAFMKRLKVRWQSAMNGRDAVKKWRSGGFHLVLMDIQLPVMNGLEATKEIRRLERINKIGAFSQSPSPSEEEPPKVASEEDKLPNSILFKSPVIIVALTASSLQSDRHEALAAGCNDFLTKPVNFIWLERKVTEWGCMQALIDFDGWRKWKDYTNTEVSGSGEGKVIKTHQRMLASGSGKNNSSEHDGKRIEENRNTKFLNS